MLCLIPVGGVCHISFATSIGENGLQLNYAFRVSEIYTPSFYP